MTKVNCKFNGKVVGRSKVNITVQTEAIDRKGNIYTMDHVVKMPKGIKVEVGQYVTCSGYLESQDGSNWIDAFSAEVLKSNPGDLSMNAWIEGEASASFIEPSSTTGVPFGIATVKVDETRRQRGVIFNYLIPKMREQLKAGAIVRLAGRLQYRKYTDKEGTEREIPEIVCNNEYTKVVKLSTKSNPFSFEGDTTPGEDVTQLPVPAPATRKAVKAKVEKSFNLADSNLEVEIPF